MSQTTRNSKIIHGTAKEVYQAFTNPEALEAWQAPGNMTAKVHHFDLRIGGGYSMSLYYPESETKMKGKTTDKEDKYSSRFTELIPFRKIVQVITFETSNPGFSGEMIIETDIEPAEAGTKVTYTFKDIPVGIKPSDNESGTLSSLNKLAEYLTKSKNSR